MSPDDRRAARAHLKRLASDQRIKMHTTQDRWRAEADVPSRQVFVPRKMVSALDYLIALHEFGHILSGLGRRIHSDQLLQPLAAGEAACWAWAVENAEPHLLRLMTEEDWDEVGRAMVSHIKQEPDTLPA